MAVRSTATENEFEWQMEKRIAPSGNYYLDPLSAGPGPPSSKPARPPRSLRRSEDDDDDVPGVAPPRVVSTAKSMSISGNYFIPADAGTELDGAPFAGKPEAAETDADILLAAEPGLLPLDIAWFWNVFTRFDHDRSGTISATELSDVLRFLGQNPLAFEVEQMVRVAAVSLDGQIGFGEFLRLMELLPAPGDVIEECFRVFDRDETGLISREELSSVLLTQGEVLSEREFERMMAYADRNGDGEVDHREFAALLTGSSAKITQEMAAITDLDIVMAVQEARAHGYDRIKRAVGRGSNRATEYIAPSLETQRGIAWGDAPRTTDAVDSPARTDGPGAPPYDLGVSSPHPDAPRAHFSRVRVVEKRRTTNGSGLLYGTGHALGRLRIGAVMRPVRTAAPFDPASALHV
jgi:Ca2+-binding EF-hand superfamily protein